mmetsp:Transcript_17086/g.49505  ORF Transcript_17086/g.49505 Transcript_17086/m.49505 type:complete len:209 (-) Transcript_17086:270-896(-)
MRAARARLADRGGAVEDPHPRCHPSPPPHAGARLLGAARPAGHAARVARRRGCGGGGAAGAARRGVGGSVAPLVDAHEALLDPHGRRLRRSGEHRADLRLWAACIRGRGGALPWLPAAQNLPHRAAGAALARGDARQHGDGSAARQRGPMAGVGGVCRGRRFPHARRADDGVPRRAARVLRAHQAHHRPRPSPARRARLERRPKAVTV